MELRTALKSISSPASPTGRRNSSRSVPTLPMPRKRLLKEGGRLAHLPMACERDAKGWPSASQTFPPHWPMRARCPRSLKQAHPVCPPTALQDVYKDHGNALGPRSVRISSPESAAQCRMEVVECARSPSIPCLLALAIWGVLADARRWFPPKIWMN
jgi:hypothetical protein